MSTTLETGQHMHYLDQLQQEVEKILPLLKDRQPGQSKWNQNMKERMTVLRALTSATLEDWKLNCPHCGAPPKMQEFDCGDGDFGSGDITCMSCGKNVGN